jgi:hypothetical protein
LEVWFIAYRHSARPDEAGIKFVPSEAATAAEGLRLESLGYVVTRIAPTSKTRMDAFLAGTLRDPGQRLLG